MLLTSNVGEFIHGRYKDPGNWRSKIVYQLQDDKLKKEHTYVLVFGLSNEEQLKVLKESDKVKILYESPKAVNKVTGHGDRPRNTLVIFELNE